MAIPPNPWLKVCGTDQPELEKSLTEQVERKIIAGNFAAHDVDYIARYPVSLSSGVLAVNDLQLEKLRRLCQLADVQLIPTKISSHRPYIGPVIVAAKKVLFSILGVLLKDTLRKQRDFNAAVIGYLTTPAGPPQH
jgi:hypothetical protein